MFNYLLLLYVFIAVSLLVIGALTVLKNGSDKLNRTFFFFSISVAGWILANYFSNDEKLSATFALLANHTVFFLAGTSLYLLYIFSKLITDFKISDKFKYVELLVICIYSLSLTPLVVEKISWTGSVYEVTFGTLSNLYFLMLLLNVVVIFGLLISRIRKSKSVEKERLKVILWTLTVWLLINIFTNAILPLFGGSFGLTSIGPLTSILLVAGLAYVIVRHKLFNLRLIVVRSLGYVLSFGVMLTIFALVSSLISQRVFNGTEGEFMQIVFNMAILLIAVLTYPHVKRYFDKLTNRIFYRDAYDPQEFLDQLNKSIVSNIEIGILLRHTTHIIEENLKSGFVQIVVPKTENTAQRIAGTKDITYSDHEINYMRGRLVGLRSKIIAIDDLGSDEDELRKILDKHDISVLVHMSATSYGQDQTIAFMILGNKKSGNIYSKADLRIIEIIADELVVAIQNALRFEEIQEFNVTLQSKVNTATGKLRRTNEKLKAMDETKDEFISMASHQLRTPLTSVKGYLSMVLEGDAGEINETQRKLLDQAFVSSQRMVYLIADLLNVSRLRTGKFVIDAGQTNLADIVEGEVSQLTEQAKAKSIALTYDKPKEFPQLLIDETKTRQVVMNFIDNALYYTQAGGRIDISLTEDNKHIYFMVKDNGLGVPKDEQKHLFTKFYRAKNARNIRPDGTGLGLFMAKKVITAQGGNILFESKEGKGSTFGFSFSKKLMPDSEEGHSG